jgi:hypothetical protein
MNEEQEQNKTLSYREKLTGSIAEYYDAVRTLTEDVKTSLGPCFDELLAPYPALTTISWRQYQQYFNDGDTTYFCVYGWTTKINGVDEDDDVDELLTLTGMAQSQFDKLLKDVRDFIEWLPANIMEELFGDHAEVKYVRGEGFTVEEIDHD